MKAWSFLLGGSRLSGWRSDAEIWNSDQHIEVAIALAGNNMQKYRKRFFEILRLSFDLRILKSFFFDRE